MNMSTEITKRRQQNLQKLVVNAGTHPLPVTAAAVGGITALLIGNPIIWVIAILVYVGLACSIFFDDEQAAKVFAKAKQQKQLAAMPDNLPTELQHRILAAHHEANSLSEALTGNSDMVSVLAEVQALADEVERLGIAAGPAVRYLDRSLGNHNPALDELRNKIRTIYDTMDNSISQISELGADAVRLSLEPHSTSQQDIADKVISLRGDLEALGEGLKVAYEH